MIKLLRNLRINVAMATVLFCFAALIGVVAALGYMASRTASDSLELIEQESVVQVDHINIATSLLNSARVKLEMAVNYLAQDRSLNAERQMNTALVELDASQARLDAFLAEPKSEEGMEHVLAIESNFSEVMELVREQYGALEKGDIADFDSLRQMLVPPSDGLTEGVNDFVAYAENNRVTMMERYGEQVEQFSLIGLGLLGLTVVMVVVIYLGLRFLVILPLYRAVESLQHIADADLSHPIDVPGNNEIGKLFAAMNDMQQSLTRIVTDVRDSSNSIFTGTTEIASGNNDLSSRTEQQAASLEETATSMEELTATVKQNADNARQASGLASDASHTAERGGQVVDRVVDTMQRISESSRKIADITGMIDSIAFQTNILALNASVEAARAGEQGRGFAVVAGEVRNLAGSSADAAHEIKQLIENSAAQVDEGSRLVAEAGETMKEVVSAVKRVTDIMDEISAASQEQSSGIDQVSSAVSQMDEVTQQNATLVQQAAAAAASLEEQARRLEQAMATFRLMEAGREVQLAERVDRIAEERRQAANDQEPVAAKARPLAVAASGGHALPLRDGAAQGDWEEF
ncbi:methyl-accepting chemotaxis protein [Parahaliea aestuarii]|uniref:HAMP domain-containing protein n=1 Tax=Parahaliea aestuarii TaxID=1852021 RepID=A0A5C9A259_9GAMM|nr:methyl-accepting chemotaxis protein [Parahaliea aestuarii]TXS94806.1 HAMP domain-containing protein [Parahaliea aestuarii]